MRWSTLVLCLCVVATTADSQKEDVESKVVRIKQGSVRGYKDPESEIFVFYNIPYATAPKGPYKYWGPLHAPAWLQTLEAVDEGVICPQAAIEGFFQNKVMKEDCLIANVYVPDTKQKNLPVLVYIHGGAFQVGFGDWVTAKKLSQDKIITVTFNYRLGIHGFLCLGTKDVPGNAGMKDQVALLRWVKKNIASFGGNPDDVTIAGYSAGSASVDLLMLSKSARGLFNKVIPESGANVAVFSAQSDPLENAKSFAKVLNFTNVEDFYALEEFYKTASLETLMKDAFLDRLDSSFVFVPCVERVTGEEVFLEDSPINILKSGKYKKVPMLYGFAEMEGLLRINFFETWKHKMNEKFSDFLPTDLKFDSPEQKEEVAKQIKEFYFGDQPVGDDSVLAYIDYFSDVFFAYPTLKAVQLHVEAGHDQIYLYEYSFTDESSPPIPHTDVRGAEHCAQTMAVLDGVSINNSSESEISEDFKKMKETMRELWFNFITTGKPVPEGSDLPPWPPVGADLTPHMSLNRKLELRGSLLQRRKLFWDQIYKEHYRSPIPPPTPPIRHSEL